MERLKQGGAQMRAHPLTQWLWRWLLKPVLWLLDKGLWTITWLMMIVTVVGFIGELALVLIWHPGHAPGVLEPILEWLLGFNNPNAPAPESWVVALTGTIAFYLVGQLIQAVLLKNSTWYRAAATGLALIGLDVGALGVVAANWRTTWYQALHPRATKDALTDALLSLQSLPGGLVFWIRTVVQPLILWLFNRKKFQEEQATFEAGAIRLDRGLLSWLPKWGLTIAQPILVLTLFVVHMVTAGLLLFGNLGAGFLDGVEGPLVILRPFLSGVPFGAGAILFQYLLFTGTLRGKNWYRSQQLVVWGLLWGNVSQLVAGVIGGLVKSLLVAQQMPPTQVEAGYLGVFSLVSLLGGLIASLVVPVVLGNTGKTATPATVVVTPLDVVDSTAVVLPLDAADSTVVALLPMKSGKTQQQKKKHKRLITKESRRQNRRKKRRSGKKRR